MKKVEGDHRYELHVNTEEATPENTIAPEGGTENLGDRVGSHEAEGGHYSGKILDGLDTPGAQGDLVVEDGVDIVYW